MSERARELIPETAEEALRRWDDGKVVFTIEMGGLGPGYEQAIQALVFEIIREHKDDELPEPETDESREWARDTVLEADERLDLGGVTGAMAGAARWLAYRYLSQGYAASIADAPEGRTIQVEKRVRASQGTG